MGTVVHMSNALREWRICLHTEHAIGEGGRVGRWFPDGALYGDPAGSLPLSASAYPRHAPTERAWALASRRRTADA